MKTQTLTQSETLRARGFFLSDDGTLYRDTQAMPIVRADYARSHREIDSGAHLRATLRAGAVAWPGGYRLALITSDGGALCFACARANLAACTWSIRCRVNDGWRVVGLTCEAESDDALTCDHCSATIWQGADDDDTDDARPCLDLAAFYARKRSAFHLFN